MPHTADIIVEAWGPTFADCLEEAVRALLDQFVARSRPAARAHRSFSVTGADEAGVLVALLEEVIFVVDTTNVVPVDLGIDVADSGRARGEFAVIELDDARQTGSVPKAVSLLDLEVAPTAAGWRSRVTVDV